MLVLQSSLINWRQIQITMLLYSHRLELVSKAFRYEELDGFSSPLRTGPEIYQNGSRISFFPTCHTSMLNLCNGALFLRRMKIFFKLILCVGSLRGFLFYQEWRLLRMAVMPVT